MDQKQLCVAAKQRQGLTSDNQLALRLGVDRSRVSKLVHAKAPADEAEIMMLADMAGIDAHLAFAAVHKDNEKNPAKRAYWERISMQFAMVMVSLTALFGVGVSDAKASGFTDRPSINYAHFRDAIESAIAARFHKQAQTQPAANARDHRSAAHMMQHRI